MDIVVSIWDHIVIDILFYLSHYFSSATIHISSYIPELGSADPSWFAVSLATVIPFNQQYIFPSYNYNYIYIYIYFYIYITIFLSSSPIQVDGQTFSYGEYNKDFPIESCMKPVLYSFSIEDHGYEHVSPVYYYNPNRWNKDLLYL